MCIFCSTSLLRNQSGEKSTRPWRPGPPLRDRTSCLTWVGSSCSPRRPSLGSLRRGVPTATPCTLKTLEWTRVDSASSSLHLPLASGLSTTQDQYVTKRSVVWSYLVKIWLSGQNSFLYHMKKLLQHFTPNRQLSLINISCLLLQYIIHKHKQIFIIIYQWNLFYILRCLLLSPFVDCRRHEVGIERWAVRYCGGGGGRDGGGLGPPRPGNCHADRRPIPTHLSKYPFCVTKYDLNWFLNICKI